MGGQSGRWRAGPEPTHASSDRTGDGTGQRPPVTPAPGLASPQMFPVMESSHQAPSRGGVRRGRGRAVVMKPETTRAFLEAPLPSLTHRVLLSLQQQQQVWRGDRLTADALTGEGGQMAEGLRPQRWVSEASASFPGTLPCGRPGQISQAAQAAGPSSRSEQTAPRSKEPAPRRDAEVPGGRSHSRRARGSGSSWAGSRQRWAGKTWMPSRLSPLEGGSSLHDGECCAWEPGDLGQHRQRCLPSDLTHRKVESRLPPPTILTRGPQASWGNGVGESGGKV